MPTIQGSTNFMKILNPNLKNDIDSGTPLKLDLGCGQRPRSDFYTVDNLEVDGVDLVADLNKPLDLLPDNCTEYIYSHHVFEHVHEFLALMREIHRIILPGGTIEIVVPHFSNVYSYSDPTHVRFFSLYSMYYFVSPENQPRKRPVPTFYTDTSTRFLLNSLSIEFYRKGVIDRIFAPLFKRTVNINIHTQDFYERRLSSLFHARQIRYIMEPEK